MNNEYLKLNEARCKDCYACIRACPVKAIGFANSQANIIADECVLCGNCYVTCPQNAKRIREDVPTCLLYTSHHERGRGKHHP